MLHSIWEKAVKLSADPARARDAAEALVKSGAEGMARPSEQQANALCSLFAGSQASTKWLLNHPECLPELVPDALEFPRHPQGLKRDVSAFLETALDALDYHGSLRQLRQFKQQEMLRIAARDLGGFGEVMEIVAELSSLADVCLSAVLEVCRARLVQRLGLPYHQDPEGKWMPTGFCVLGLGKLGGQELNYSSDVDVVFVYEEEGLVFKEPPEKKQDKGTGVSNHAFFKKLAEEFSTEVSRASEDGQLFRIDLRLRPEGDGGPLVRSIGSYENYYAQWGQTWERMMLIKARCVAGDIELAHEFLEMVNPFRYPRSLGERVLEEIAAMKRRIEKEVVKAGEMERNVKLGYGGIREIEFIVQSQQLLHAGRIPFLQGAQTLPALKNLVRYRLMKESEADILEKAYCFLRNVEHRLQMEEHRQTHTIPEDRASCERLARLMGCDSRRRFDQSLKKHTANVRSIYDPMFAVKREHYEGLPAGFEGEEEEWEQALERHGFRDPAKAVKLLKVFVHGPGFVHVSPHTERLALGLVRKMATLCPTAENLKRLKGEEVKVLSDPDRVLTRVDSFVSAYGSRAGLFETWTQNPSLFELILLLFDRSEFLAETAIAIPDLVDDLMLSGWLRRRKDAGMIYDELMEGIEDDDQHQWLRRYHRSEQMRIGLREILGLMQLHEVNDVLSSLAEACLRYSLKVVLKRHKLRKAPFTIMGLGKLGGREINYGSDLDIIFVAPVKTRNLQRLQKIAKEVMELLSKRTENGIVFETDARLRPDGEQSLLVTTMDACENYYRKRAMLWEIQSLTRMRPVAGDERTGEEFLAMARLLSDFRDQNVKGDFCAPSKKKGSKKSKASDEMRGLKAYRPDWKATIAAMRGRIERERTPAGKDHLAIKTGAGGLIDAEFLAQAWSLEHGWHEPSTLRAIDRACAEKILSPKKGEAFTKAYRELRRIEEILRRWSYEGETVLPDEEKAFRRVAIRCGFPDADTFSSHLDKTRRAIRETYGEFLSEESK